MTAGQPPSPTRFPLRCAGPIRQPWHAAYVRDYPACGWSNGKPAYRCRHGHTSAASPDPARPKNTYVREDQILPHLAAIGILLAGVAGKPGCRNRGPAQVTSPADAAGLIDQLRTDGIVLTYNRQDRTLRAGRGDVPSVAIGKNR